MNTQFKKGVIELCVLSLLRNDDKYGYEIVKDLSEPMEISINTIYPILRRLTNEGYFSTYEGSISSGQVRKYYTITKKGIEYYTKLYDEWKKFLNQVSVVLEGGMNND